jgi:hypothetical protein
LRYTVHCSDGYCERVTGAMCSFVPSFHTVTTPLYAVRGTDALILFIAPALRDERARERGEERRGGGKEGRGREERRR